MRKKNKGFYFILIILILCGVSIGYAAMNRTLNITGNSEISKNTWDIYFENVKVMHGSVAAVKEPVIDNSKLTVDFAFNLNLPGDFYEFTVDVMNMGTIDAMIDGIIKTPELTDSQKKYLNYIIEYENGEQINSKQLLACYSFVRIKVRVEYRTDLTESDLPTIFENLDLGFTVNYVQSDSSSSKVNDNGIKNYVSADGDINEIGTIVTIGTEKFYTIGTEGDNVKLLSMYNLYVGGSYNFVNDAWTVYGNEATGMQNELMRGYNGGEIFNGTTVFSSTSKYYIGSKVEEYVNSYRDKLEKLFGISVTKARLITLDELTSEEYGCVKSSNTSYHCNNDNYQWIFSTSYWTSSNGTSTTGDVWVMFRGGHMSIEYHNANDVVGVRPVIFISKSEFNNNEADDVISFSIKDSNGNSKKLYANEGMTWAEFIGSDYNTSGLSFYEDYIVFSDENYRIVDRKTNDILKNNRIIDNYDYYTKYVYVSGPSEPS